MPQSDITPFVLSTQALSRLNTLPATKMVVTRSSFPRYALALKAASKVSDESLPSEIRCRLASHVTHRMTRLPSFVQIISLPRAMVFTPCTRVWINAPKHSQGPFFLVLVLFKISALTAAIHEKNTSTRVHPYDIDL